MRVLGPALATLLLTSGLASGQSVPEWSLVPTLRIGAVEGPNALDVVGSVVVSANSGNVYINERSQHITAFGADGRRLRRFGGQGDGPGEFRNLASDLYWSDGFVVAVDGRASRLTRFTEDGEVVDSRVIRSGVLPGSAERADLVAPLSGNFFLGSAGIEIESEGLIRGGEQLVRMDREGNATVLDRKNGVRFVRLGSLFFPIPAQAISYHSVHPHGGAVVIVHQDNATSARTEQFRVRKVGGDGNVVFARSYSYAPRALPDGYTTEFIERRLNDLRRNGRPVPDGVERTVTPHVPRFLPPVNEVRMGADGSTWLRREMIPGKDDPVTWWVLNERGDLVGRLLLPGRLQLRYIDRDTVWGIERDDLDVNYVVRYRIQR